MASEIQSFDSINIYNEQLNVGIAIVAMNVLNLICENDMLLLN
jgi:hypothetical protein